jgi:hypothetical protein
MKRIIGLDRELKLGWLELASAAAQAEPNKVKLRARLMQELEEEIPAHFVRYKTCTVLIRTWLTVPKEQIALRNRAFDLARAVSPNQRLALHWGMLLLAYPFFRESVFAIGRALETQDAISRIQISRKIVESWGDRSTVKRSVLRVFQTLEEWQALVPTSNDENRASPVRVINDMSLALWLAEVILYARTTALPLPVLQKAPENFPFRLNLTSSNLTESGRFDGFREGTDLLIGIRHTG